MSDLPEYRQCPREVIVTEEWRDKALSIVSEHDALKAAARALLDALPRCACIDDPQADTLLSDSLLCRFTPHHHKEIKALEALL